VGALLAMTLAASAGAATGQTTIASPDVADNLSKLAPSGDLQRAAGVGGQRPVGILGNSSVLFDQFDAASGNGTPDQDFETALDAFDAQAADDFVVPADAAWLVRELRTIGSTTVSGGATISVAIHLNASGGGSPDLPGSPVAGCSYSNLTPTTDTAGSFVIRLPAACLLTSGRYWLSLQTRQDVATHGQHFWSNRAVQSGSEAVWRNPGNGFGSGCTVFRPQLECGVGGGASPDLLFQVVGEPAGADLAVAIAAGPDPVVAGQAVQYQIEVRNLGPAPARDTELLLTLAPGVAPQSAGASQGGICTPAVASVRCRWSGLTAAGVALAATVGAQIPAASTHGSSLRADVVVSSTSNDPEAANNAAAALTSISTAANLQLAQATATPQSVVAGANLQLAAIINNDGPSDARDVSLAIDLPADLVLLSIQASGANCSTGTVLTCTWPGATPPGASLQVQVVTQLRPSAAKGTLNVPMRALSATFDPVAAGNSTVVSAEVLTRADLSLALAAGPDPVLAGHDWTIQADIANAGPSDARDVRVVFSLPPGISVVQMDPGPGGNCSVTTQLECIWAGATTVADGRALIARLHVAPSMAGGTTVTSVAIVTAQTGDDATNNNSVTAHTLVQTSADLQISLQAMPSALAVGAVGELRVQAHNLGPSDAQTVEVEIALGVDLRFAGVDANGADCQLPQIGLSGTVRCRWAGGAPPQASRELRVRASGGSDGRAEVIAVTTALTADGDTSNNRETLDIVVGTAPREIPALGANGKWVLCLLLAALAIRRERV
jgi:uncharacterized repeat protein (TIGR01451 family)